MDVSWGPFRTGTWVLWAPGSVRWFSGALQKRTELQAAGVCHRWNASPRSDAATSHVPSQYHRGVRQRCPEGVLNDGAVATTGASALMSFCVPWCKDTVWHFLNPVTDPEHRWVTESSS